MEWNRLLAYVLGRGLEAGGRVAFGSADVKASGASCYRELASVVAGAADEGLIDGFAGVPDSMHAAGGYLTVKFERVTASGVERHRLLRGAAAEAGTRVAGPVANTSEVDTTKEPSPVFAFDDGTRWQDVSIYRVDGHTISVAGPGLKRRTRATYHTLGMVDRRSTAPNTCWELLMELCEGGGCWETEFSSAEFTRIKQRVSEARKTLKGKFGIDADPFKSFLRKGGLTSAFRAYAQPPDDTYVGDVLPADDDVN